MAQEFSPSIFQAALLEVAEATKAATAAVQAMQVVQQQQPAIPQGQTVQASGSPSGSPTSSTDWSKLVNKPPVLDGKSVEDEIRMFRDWLWIVTQFLNTIDVGYEPEIQAIVDPHGHVDSYLRDETAWGQALRPFGLPMQKQVSQYHP